MASDCSIKTPPPLQLHAICFPPFLTCMSFPHSIPRETRRFAGRLNGPRLSDVRAQRVVRVLVLRRHRQHIVEAGNPLEVGDAQVNRRGLLAHEHPHPVGHGWLVVATRRGAGAPKEEFYRPRRDARGGAPKEKSVGHITAVMRLLCWLS